MADIIKIRRDTSENWVLSNPVLDEGEMGYETDTRKQKVGDGSTAWNSLDYVRVDLENSTGQNANKPISQKAATDAIAIVAQSASNAADAAQAAYNRADVAVQNTTINVFLTQEEYDELVENEQINPDFLYNIYEE